MYLANDCMYLANNYMFLASNFDSELKVMQKVCCSVGAVENSPAIYRGESFVPDGTL